MIRFALSLLALLLSLGLVTWRQSRALELSREVDEARQARALAESDVARLEQGIRALESRTRVVRDAAARLGMRMPTASEIVILPMPYAGEDSAANESERAVVASLIARFGARLRGVAAGDAGDDHVQEQAPELANVAGGVLAETGGDR